MAAITPASAAQVLTAENEDEGDHRRAGADRVTGTDEHHPAGYLLKGVTLPADFATLASVLAEAKGSA